MHALFASIFLWHVLLIILRFHKSGYRVHPRIQRSDITGETVRILAIDTALAACAACVLESDTNTLLSEETLLLERGHAEALLPLVERVIARSGAGFSALDRVAVTTGPGSFTGLRVGISAARAIALAAEIPVVGVSTLSALLAPLMLAKPRTGGVIAAAIDARHGHIYFQSMTSDGRSLIAPCHIAIRDAARLLGSGPVKLAGNAAALLADEARAIGLDVTVPDENANAPDIRLVALLGHSLDPLTAPPAPFYLRGADAKPQDKARLPRQ